MTLGMANNLMNDGNQLQKDKDANQVRFEEDLEFVQSLANPLFVQELTFNGTLRSEPMVNYLAYLKYFHEPDYARFVRYPNALKVLDLLNESEQFRKMIETQESAQLLMDKLIQNWISLSGRLNKVGPMVVKEITTETHATHESNGLVQMVQTDGGSVNDNSP